MQDRESKPEFPYHHKRKKKKEQQSDKPRNLLHEYPGSFISTFVFLIFAIVIYDLIFPNFDHNVDFQALKDELKTNVHNQSEALSVSLDSLDKFESNECPVCVVNFIGSTGVGKTFIANIIKHHFHSTYQEVKSSLKTNTQRILSTIQNSHYKYNLIIFDDLTANDVDDVVAIITKLPEDVMTFVICIFNIQETDQFLTYSIRNDHIVTIEAKFQSANIAHKTAKFHEFKKDEVKRWIIKQLVKKGVEEDLYSKIVDSLLNGHNVENHGLKGLNAKLNLEL